MQAAKEDIRIVDRLKKRSDFLRLQQGGKKWISKGVIVQSAPNEGQGKRFGITVSKRVSKSAVERNRIKRRLRAAAADILPAGLKDNTDIVLIGRPETARRLYADLKRDLAWCLGKMDIGA